MQNVCYDTFSELFEEISKIKTKNVVSTKEKHRKEKYFKTLMFVYREIFDFPGYDEEIKVFVSKNVLDSILNLIFTDIVIHHSYISGNVIGYAHNFCNQKYKENKRAISVFAHNLFRFDFFFILKGLRLCVWRTKNLNMGGKGIQNLN